MLIASVAVIFFCQDYMKIKLLAVGTKMPSWVTEGFAEYTKRLSRDITVELTEVALGTRSKNADTKKAIKQESDHLLAHIEPQDYVIALEVKGQSWNTEQLAEYIERWQMAGHTLVLLVGGPDGLSEQCRQRANLQWSLSALTLPHTIVRVLLAEQIYRAWSIIQKHPYHRS